MACVLNKMTVTVLLLTAATIYMANVATSISVARSLEEAEIQQLECSPNYEVLKNNCVENVKEAFKKKDPKVVNSQCCKILKDTSDLCIKLIFSSGPFIPIGVEFGDQCKVECSLDSTLV